MDLLCNLVRYVLTNRFTRVFTFSAAGQDKDADKKAQAVPTPPSTKKDQKQDQKETDKEHK